MSDVIALLAAMAWASLVVTLVSVHKQRTRMPANKDGFREPTTYLFGYDGQLVWFYVGVLHIIAVWIGLTVWMWLS